MVIGLLEKKIFYKVQPYPKRGFIWVGLPVNTWFSRVISPSGIAFFVLF
jgi:hypothetical protein